MFYGPKHRVLDKEREREKEKEREREGVGRENQNRIHMIRTYIVLRMGLVQAESATAIATAVRHAYPVRF